MGGSPGVHQRGCREHHRCVGGGQHEVRLPGGLERFRMVASELAAPSARLRFSHAQHARACPQPLPLPLTTRPPCNSPCVQHQAVLAGRLRALLHPCTVIEDLRGRVVLSQLTSATNHKREKSIYMCIFIIVILGGERGRGSCVRCVCAVCA